MQQVARLVLSVLLNLVATLAEAAGIFAGSLALLADAAHNLNDTASLGISLGARKVAQRDADRRRTFGYRRAEVIGAFINLITLVLIDERDLALLETTKRILKDRLADAFGIEHATLEFEWEPCGAEEPVLFD